MVFKWTSSPWLTQRSRTESHAPTSHAGSSIGSEILRIAPPAHHRGATSDKRDGILCANDRTTNLGVQLTRIGAAAQARPTNVDSSVLQPVANVDACERTRID